MPLCGGFFCTYCQSTRNVLLQLWHCCALLLQEPPTSTSGTRNRQPMDGPSLSSRCSGGSWEAVYTARMCTAYLILIDNHNDVVILAAIFCDSYRRRNPKFLISCPVEPTWTKFQIVLRSRTRFHAILRSLVELFDIIEQAIIMA